MKRKRILIPVISTIVIILLIIIFNPNTRYKKISINDTKWESLKASKTQNNSLILLDVEFNDYNLMIDEKNSILYYSLINDNRKKYNPNVKYKASDENAKLAILSDDITDEKVKSDYKFQIMIYNNSEYHVYSLIFIDLPLLNISYNENTEKKNIPMQMYLFDNLTNTHKKVTKSAGKIKIDKDDYTFSLNMITPGNNIRENRISILNMKPSDSYILSKVDDSENKQENGKPEKNRVALFFNSEYKGIYYLDI